MAEWRFARGWSEKELLERLRGIQELPRNFSARQEEMTVENGWNHYHSYAVIGYESPGAPLRDGFFQRMTHLIADYKFSDPGIVTAHFDPERPLLGRRLLLEIKVLGLRYLCGVVVGALREETNEDRSVWGFRYDTLEGHIECGSEWFILRKDHATGAIRFRIEAAWRPGQFPNWWSRVGFWLLARHYQRAWHHRAHGRLFRLAYDEGLIAPDTHGRLAHEGPEVTFKMIWPTRKEAS